MPKLSIVIPCYNERANIETLLSRVLAFPLPEGWEREVIVVDDASVDGTRDILKNLSLPVTVFYQEENGGKGSALTRGFKEATGTHILIQDADLEYDPNDIPALLAAIDGPMSAVYGSRNLHHTKREGFWVQRAGVWVITKLINGLYRVRLTDVWTCYKLFPREAAHTFRPGRFESELLFTAELLRAGHAIKEVPIAHYPRPVSEGKKIRYRDGVWGITALILDYLAHIRAPRAYMPKDTSAAVVCPACYESLVRTNDSYQCETHGAFLIDAAGRPHLIEQGRGMELITEHLTGINWLKSFLKQFPALYYSIWQVFCPALMLVNGPRRIFKYVSKDGLILDIGSGPERIAPEFVNIDVAPFPQVDVVADAQHLPFADGTVDAVVSESMLEHVPDAPAVAKEMMRVLAPGGYLYTSIPFIHPYHASPDDFNRYTVSGLKHLFNELEVVELGVRSGPWSAFLIFLAYWLGVVFSFGSRKAAPFLAHIFMLILGPLKVFDLLFTYLPGAEAVAAHVYIIARKVPYT